MSSSRALRSFVAVAALVALTASAKPSKKIVAAEAAKLTALASEKLLADAVIAQNAREMPIVAVKLLDNRWVIAKEAGLVRRTINGACADRLREFLTANPTHEEAVLLDFQGASVCASDRLDNYWFGDQPYWQQAIDGKVYSDGEGRFAVPVVSEEKTIGVITSRVKF